MPLTLILACLWFIAANLGALFPSRHNHRPLAWALIVCGIPLLGFATSQHGPWVGLLLLAGGVSVLRWPVMHLGRWLKRRVSSTQ
ncbi:DUF2484 family protein [Oceaniglobus indicus]|uniref:DUF2484 family protein n=1 Tax=Oceaniglobus indicus TaxID=2047749 RepID=UPI000C1979B9|nr:DUF2484 family protein [Oceaniglobus indicus]